jgi:hypothetical protein
MNTLLSGGVESRHALVASDFGRGTQGTGKETPSGSSDPPTQSLWDIAPDEAHQFYVNDIYEQCAGEAE